jgi:hypothetical protein
LSRCFFGGAVGSIISALSVFVAVSIQFGLVLIPITSQTALYAKLPKQEPAELSGRSVS